MDYSNYFLHVGMCKTATTFVQKSIFPAWPDMQYLRFRNLEYFLTLPQEKKYILSCEGFTGRMFGPLAEKKAALSRLADIFPGANVLVSVRHHGSYIASLYSQYLRYGGSQSFAQFSNFRDRPADAFFQKEDFCFQPIIEHIESQFGREPFVYEMEEVTKGFDELKVDLARFFCSRDFDENFDEMKQKNPSLKHWQGNLLRQLNQLSQVKPSKTGRTRPYGKLIRWRIDPPTVCRNYLGLLPGQPLVDKDSRDEVNSAYAADWDFVSNYIENSQHRS